MLFFCIIYIAGLDLRTFPILAESVIPDSSDVVEEGGQLQKLWHRERRPYRQGAKHIVKIPVVSEGNRTLSKQMGKRGLGLCLCMFYFKQAVHRHQFPAHFFAGL